MVEILSVPGVVSEIEIQPSNVQVSPSSQDTIVLAQPASPSRPLSYEEIMQKPEVRAAKSLEEQDRIILSTYRKSRDRAQRQEHEIYLSNLAASDPLIQKLK